ncbi:MAG TPA: hypothetical protein DCM05_04280 [Elusimicrobia bacterium]|nr:hypothetical protein [Elusimicrobiota bacterium]
MRLALGLLLALAPAAHARTLSWEDCVAIASKNNPELASSARGLEASRASYYGSYNAFLPSLNLSNGYANSYGQPMSWSAQASVGLDILDMRSVAGIRSSYASYQQAQAALRQASANLRLNLKRAFSQLLYAQRTMEVSKTIRDIRERDGQTVSLLYDSGRESKGNMLRAKAQMLQAEADLAQAQRSLRTAQKSLNRYLGLDDFDAVAASGELIPGELPEQAKDLRPFVSARPDVAVQEAALKGAEASLSQARSSLWPTFSINYSRSRTGDTEFPNDRTSWSYSGQLGYALFGGGPTSTYFAEKSARRSLERSEQDLRSVRNGALVELETTWSSFAGALDGVKVQLALLEAARQRNDEADVRYASGLMTFDNWEIIVSERVNSERQALSAQLEAVNAEAGWKKALGKGLGE